MAGVAMAMPGSFDRMGTLRNLLQVMAFCLTLAAVQVAFNPERPYGPVATFSLCIGLVTWAVIDLGRHWFPSAAETGWPTGVPGLLLVAGGIGAGWFLGHSLGDALCMTLGLFSPDSARTAPDTRTDLLITILAGGVGTGYFYVQHRGAWLERRKQEAEALAADARLKLLQSQLDPHMLFNTLANLRVLIGLDPARAQAMLDHLDAFLRSTLTASRGSTHTLQAEFDRLRDYLALMAVRMGPRLQVTLDLPPELAGVRVPTLLLQPLVENAIRHGLEPQVAGGQVTISAARHDGSLLLTVADTGVGLPPSTGTLPSAGGGFGLASVRERLATLYGDQARIDCRPNIPSGVCAQVRLPCPESVA